MMYMIGKFEKNGSGSMQGMCSKNWNSRQRAPVLVTYLERFSPADAPSRVEENYFARKPKRTSANTLRSVIKMNKAVYTAISVACGWAGAVMSLCKP